MDLVVIESPYAGQVAENLQYAKRAVMDCLKRGEAPYASHLFFTQDGILDDLIPAERKLGIEAGFAWAKAAKRSAFYLDRGISSGMIGGVHNAVKAGRDIVLRCLDGEVTDGMRDAIDVIIAGVQTGAVADRNPVDTVVGEVVDELLRAEAKFAKFNSRHEVFAVLYEEFDELWDEIKANDYPKARKEAIQVAAMALRYLRDF